MNKENEIFKIIKKEKIKQKNNINLIASENYVSKNTLKAQSSILTNKYAEGYPKKRYYSGCENIDKIEEITIKNVKKLFKVKYANVQSHSGTQANIASYISVAKIGDIILSMNIKHGGHISHGSNINLSGKIYKVINYKTDIKTGRINYNEIESLSKKFKPKIIIAGFSSYSRIINWKILKNIAQKTNSYLIADISHVAGLIAKNLYPSPINIADIITSTTHKTLRGPRGGIIMTNNINIKIKIDAAIFPGTQGGPMMHTIASKSIAINEANKKEFKNYQKQTIKNAKFIAKNMLNRNYKIISKGTDNHLLVINLNNRKITGIDAEKALKTSNIIVNKNLIPNDILHASKTSGIRIGTPAITSRKFRKKEIKILSKNICDILDNIKNINKIKKIKKKIIKIIEKTNTKNENNII